MEIHQGFTCSPRFPCKPFSGNREAWEAGALQRFVHTLSEHKEEPAWNLCGTALGMTKDSQRAHLHPRTSPAIWCLCIQWPSCQNRGRDNLVSLLLLAEFHARAQHTGFKLQEDWYRFLPATDTHPFLLFSSCHRTLTETRMKCEFLTKHIQRI